MVLLQILATVEQHFGMLEFRASYASARHPDRADPPSLGSLRANARLESCGKPRRSSLERECWHSSDDGGYEHRL